MSGKKKKGKELLLPVSEKAMDTLQQARVTQLLSFDRQGLLLLASKGQDEAFKQRAQTLDSTVLARVIVMREKAAYIWRRNIAFAFLLLVVLVGGTVALVLTLAISAAPCAKLPSLTYPWPVQSNLTWTDCPMSNTELNVSAQCVSVNVPMSWAPNSPNCQSKQTVGIFAKRVFLGSPSAASTQLWWIGRDVSAAYEDAASQMVLASQGAVVVYLTDKRGTGRSDFFDCVPDSFRSNLTACLLSLAQDSLAQDRLATTSYSNLAYDLIYLLQCFRSAQRSVLMGSSLGGLTVQRLLAIMEETTASVLDAVILDSAPPAGGFNLSESFLNSDAIAGALVAECHSNPLCSSHFGTQGGLAPWLTVYGARDQLLRLGVSGQHPCLPLLPTSFQNLSWAITFQLLQPGTFQLLPALLLRLARCNESDLAALTAFVEQIPPVSALDSPLPGASLVVDWALDWTENYFGALTLNDTSKLACSRLAGADALTFGSTKTTRMICDGWGMAATGGPDFLHAADSYTSSIPNMTFVSVPVLQLHGEWDPVVSIALAYNYVLNYSLQNSNYTFVSVPRSGHTVYDSSPTENGTCGFDMILSFVLSSDFVADTSCLSRILPIDFLGNSESSREQTLRFFNISSNCSDAMWNA